MGMSTMEEDVRGSMGGATAGLAASLAVMAGAAALTGVGLPVAILLGAAAGAVGYWGGDKLGRGALPEDFLGSKGMAEDYMKDMSPAEKKELAKLKKRAGRVRGGLEKQGLTAEKILGGGFGPTQAQFDALYKKRQNAPIGWYSKDPYSSTLKDARKRTLLDLRATRDQYFQKGDSKNLKKEEMDRIEKTVIEQLEKEAYGKGTIKKMPKWAKEGDYTYKKINEHNNLIIESIAAERMRLIAELTAGMEGVLGTDENDNQISLEDLDKELKDKFNIDPKTKEADKRPKKPTQRDKEAVEMFRRKYGNDWGLGKEGGVKAPTTAAEVDALLEKRKGFQDQFGELERQGLLPAMFTKHGSRNEEGKPMPRSARRQAWTRTQMGTGIERKGDMGMFDEPTTPQDIMDEEARKIKAGIKRREDVNKKGYRSNGRWIIPGVGSRPVRSSDPYNSGGFVPNFSAAAMELNNSYSRAGTRVVGLKGIGLANTEETLGHHPRFTQPFVNPPEGSKEGMLHKMRAISRTGVNPYMIPNTSLSSQGSIPEIDTSGAQSSLGALTNEFDNLKTVLAQGGFIPDGSGSGTSTVTNNMSVYSNGGAMAGGSAVDPDLGAKIETVINAVKRGLPKEYARASMPTR